MFIIPTASQLKRKRAVEDSPVTAGTAKTPPGGLKSKAELTALGTRMNWDATRELTLRDLRTMASDEYQFHEALNPSFQKVFETRANITHNAEVEKQMAVKRMFEDRATPEETEVAMEQTRKFAASFPQGQFASVPENRKKLIAWMREHNLPITVENLSAGFAELAMSGELVLSAAVLGDDRQLSGEVLRNYSRLDELIQPQRMPTAVDKMSADEWKASRPELQEKQVPPMVMQGWNRLLATFASMHPEFVDSGAARIKLLEAVRSRKMNVSIQSIELVFDELAKKGELQTDISKNIQGQAVRVVDLGGRR